MKSRVPRTAPADPGLQLERTALSWERTSLALFAGSLIAGRILLDLIGIGSLAVAGLGIITSVTVFSTARRRYVVRHKALTGAEGEGVVRGSGVMPFTVAALAMVLGIVGAVFVIATV